MPDRARQKPPLPGRVTPMRRPLRVEIAHRDVAVVLPRCRAVPLTNRSASRSQRAGDGADIVRRRARQSGRRRAPVDARSLWSERLLYRLSTSQFAGRFIVPRPAHFTGVESGLPFSTMKVTSALIGVLPRLIPSWILPGSTMIDPPGAYSVNAPSLSIVNVPWVGSPTIVPGECGDPRARRLESSPRLGALHSPARRQGPNRGNAFPVRGARVATRTQGTMVG